MQLVECQTGEEKGRARLRPATIFFQKLHLTSDQDMGEEKKKREKEKKVVHTGHRDMCTVPYVTRVQSSVTPNISCII